MEFNAQNILEAKYIHSDQVDEVMVMERPRSPHTNESFPAQKYYYHHDRLGSVTEVTNLIGDVVQRYVYDSFGNTSIYNKDGTAITESSTDYLKTPYTFTGRERDPETGLHYHRARYYNPTAGRWISSDPTEFDSGDSNFYRYAGNNSLNYTDPDGKNPFLIGGIIAGIGIIFNPTPTDTPGAGVDEIIEGGGIIGGGALCSKINRNRFIRIGPGKRRGRKTIRIAIGGKKGKKIKITLIDLGPL